MQQDVLADDQTVVVAQRVVRQQIVLGKRDLGADFVDHLHMTWLGRGPEVP